MSGPWGNEGPLDDQTFIYRLRDLIDPPNNADEQFSPTGTATKFRCNVLKIYEDDYLQLTNNASPVPLVFRLSDLTSGNAYIDCRTGLITMGTAPGIGTNTLVIYKNKVQWLDSSLLGALYGGMLWLFPKMWRDATDTSITTSTNQWDYTLPSDFNDSRVRIKAVGTREIPSGSNRFKPLGGWQRNGTSLRFARSQSFTPGTTLEIQYAAPYRELSDVEIQAAECLTWYAAAQLLGFSEAGRTRQDTAPASDANANPPGYKQNTGGWFMSQARSMRDTLTRPMPMGPPRSTYDV